MDRIAITSSGPYTGATTLARFLASMYGYTHISMSRVLIAEFIKRYQLPLTVQDIEREKHRWRRDLQAFGVISGFGTQPGWIEICLREHGGNISKKVVIEKVRTDVQAETLKKYGFFVVELTVTPPVRVARARSMGVTLGELEVDMMHPVEMGISTHNIDSVISSEQPIADIANWLSGKGNTEIER